ARAGAGEPGHQEADEAVSRRYFRNQTALNGRDFGHARESGDAAADEHHDQDEAKNRNAETPGGFRIAADRPHVETEAGPRHGQRIEDERGQGVDETEMHPRMKEIRQPRGFDKGRRLRTGGTLRRAPARKDENAYKQGAETLRQKPRVGFVDEPKRPQHAWYKRPQTAADEAKYR